MKQGFARPNSHASPKASPGPGLIPVESVASKAGKVVHRGIMPDSSRK